MAGPSVTTTDPICRLFMRGVASVNDASTSQVTGGTTSVPERRWPWVLSSVRAALAAGVLSRLVLPPV